MCKWCAVFLTCQALLTCQPHLESGFVARALAVVGPDRGGVRNGGRKLRDAPLESLDEGWERHGELRLAASQDGARRAAGIPRKESA